MPGHLCSRVLGSLMDVSSHAIKVWHFHLCGGCCSCSIQATCASSLGVHCNCSIPATRPHAQHGQHSAFAHGRCVTWDLLSGLQQPQDNKNTALASTINVSTSLPVLLVCTLLALAHGMAVTFLHMVVVQTIGTGVHCSTLDSGFPHDI